MKIKTVAVLLFSVFLIACAQKTPPPAQKASYADRAYRELAQAAQTSSAALTQLSATEQAANPPQSVSEPPSPTSYGMAHRTSIEWNGPIQPLVQKIANYTNYQLRVLGSKPPIPVIVVIKARNTRIGDILRDAGYQAGNKAQVVVFPDSKTIELRYAN